MNARSLNLLRYPRRVQLLESAPLRAALLALGAGTVLGGSLGLWQQAQHEALLARRVQLKAQFEAWRSQQATERDRQRLLSSWGRRVQAWQAQGEQQMQLHAVLLAQAVTAGLRVDRWQGDGRQLVLQAWLPRADGVPALLSALSQAWPPGWTLQSVSDHSGVGVDVVLQAGPLAGAPDGEPQKP